MPDWITIGAMAALASIVGVAARFMQSRLAGEVASVRQTLAQIRLELDQVKEDVCGLRDIHTRCSVGRAGDAREFTRLEGRMEMLAQEVRMGLKGMGERLELMAADQTKRATEMQTQVLRDLAGVSDVVHLRLRAELDPLLRIAADMMRGDRK